MKKCLDQIALIPQYKEYSHIEDVLLDIILVISP